jgi:hypothetical protein
MRIDVTKTAHAFLAQAQWQLDDGDTKGAARSAHEAAWLLGAHVPDPPQPTEEDYARDREIRARTPAYLRRAGLAVPGVVVPGRKKRRGSRRSQN